MKKTFLKIIFVFGLFLFGCNLISCSDKSSDDFYEYNDFFLPIATKGYEIDSVRLLGELTSSKIVCARNEEELFELLNLFCSKKPEYIGTMNFKEFFYSILANDIPPTEFPTFNLRIDFYSEKKSRCISCDYYVTLQGAMFFTMWSDPDEDSVYKYTSNAFLDYEAVSECYTNWGRKK